MGVTQDCAENTDRELWREREGDYYADSIHVTAQGGIGINCGGNVFVKTLRAWHELANASTHADEPVANVDSLNTARLRIIGHPDVGTALFAHPSAGIRSEVIEECAKIALTVLRRPLEQHTLPADVTSVRKAWGYAYAMGGNHMSEDIHKAIRALGESS